MSVTVLSDEARAAVRAAFVDMLNRDRSVCNLSAAQMAAKIAAMDDAIGGFLALTTDPDLDDRQLDWLLRALAVKRYEAKHG